METDRYFSISALLLLVMVFCISPVMAASPAAAADQPDQQQMQPGQRMHADLMMQSQNDSQTDAPIFVGPGALEKIQRQLRKKGDNPGLTDGIWGLSTAAAVRSFQRSQGLTATGNLNLETIQALGLLPILNGTSGDIANLEKKRLQASRPGARLYISPAALQDVQQALHLQGFTVGQADGIWGEKTQAAIRRYQHDNDMTPTGHIDLGVLDRLGMIQLVARLGFGVGVPGGREAMAQQHVGSQPDVHGYYGRGGGSNQMQENRVMQGQGQAAGLGAPLFAGTDMIRRIQQALSDAGHNPGQINGQWSASTEKALGEYQIAENLAPTGTLTISTVQNLVGRKTEGAGQRQMNTKMKEDKIKP